MVALGFDMHLADQRASGIYKQHLPRLGRSWDRFRHAMGGKDHGAVIGAVVQFLDKDRALVSQAVDHEFVMHDFVAHIDRRAPFFQGHFHDLDGAVHAGAKAARGCQIKGQCGHGGALSGPGLFAPDLTFGRGFV